MKIISKFRDYYDIGLSYGVDESLVYVRNTDIVVDEIVKDTRSVLDLIQFEHTSKWHHGPWGLYNRASTAIIVVGFCGVLYPAVILKKNNREEQNLFDNHTIYYKWDDEITSIVQQSVYNRDDNALPNFFKKFLNTKPVECHEIFHKHNTPTLLIPESRLNIANAWNLELQVPARGYSINHIITNPNLQDLEFYKVVDPYTAFQEVMGYLSGVLPSISDGEENIPDIYRRDAKGFDKYSFKKPPTKKK